MTLDERIGRYIAKCPAAVSGSDGHGTTFKVAVALVNGFALDTDASMRWMLVYNACCMPPWKPRELRHKVAQAEKVAHTKPCGHLLGLAGHSRLIARHDAPKPVPVRLKPREGRFRTVRTVVLKPYSHAHTHTSETGGGKEASEPSVMAGVSAESRPRVFDTSVGKGMHTVHILGSKLAPHDWSALLAIDPPLKVPGCNIPRPSEITMADEDWHALEAAGFADDPLIQLALVTFGPGCTVVESREGNAVRIRMDSRENSDAHPWVVHFSQDMMIERCTLVTGDFVLAALADATVRSPRTNV